MIYDSLIQDHNKVTLFNAAVPQVYSRDVWTRECFVFGGLMMVSVFLNYIFKASLFAVFKGFLALKTPSCVADGLL